MANKKNKLKKFRKAQNQRLKNEQAQLVNGNTAAKLNNLLDEIYDDPSVYPTVPDYYPQELRNYVRLINVQKVNSAYLTKPLSRMVLGQYRKHPAQMMGVVADIKIANKRQASLLIHLPSIVQDDGTLKIFDSHIWIGTDDILCYEQSNKLTLSVGDAIVFNALTKEYHGRSSDGLPGIKYGLQDVVIRQCGINVSKSKHLNREAIPINFSDNYPRHGDWILKSNENFVSNDKFGRIMKNRHYPPQHDSKAYQNYRNTAKFEFKPSAYGTYMENINATDDHGRLARPEVIKENMRKSIEIVASLLHLPHKNIKAEESVIASMRTVLNDSQEPNIVDKK